MRSTKTLVSIIAMAVVLSCALWTTRASADNGSAITYHNGAVMAGTTDVYTIWYGNWVALTGPNSLDTQTNLINFLTNIGGSPRFQINATYPGNNGAPTGGLIFGGSVPSANPQGVDLDVTAIRNIVSTSIGFSQLPYDPNGIYLVYASSDIASTATGLCTPNAPPHHGAFLYGSQWVRYAFIGNAARCPNVLAPQFFAPDGSQLPTPNGNLAADAMVSTTIHAIEGTISDPFHNGWYDGFGLENADKCVGSFSHTQTLANGARANFVYPGHPNYLIQDNWVNNYGGYCSTYNDAPPRVDDQTVQVSQDSSKSITLTGVDDNGDPFSFIIVTPPQHGTLTGSGATRTYTPAANYHGPDSFTFKANDGTLDSQSVATVSINVNTNSATDGFDPNANGVVRVAVVQPDGKILIGGDFTSLAPNGRLPVTRNYLARLNIDGTVDPTFNPSANSSVQAIALQPDGKILVGGDFSLFAPNGGASTSRSYLARLNADGTVDGTLDPRANGSVHAIAVQADGAIVIGGEFTGFFPGGGSLVGRNRVARLNPNGTLDATFNPNANSTVDALLVQPDGRSIIGGKFTTLTPPVPGGAWIRRYIARLNVDGTVDQSFDPNADNIVGGVAIQPDGKVLFGGSFTAVGPNDGALIPRNHLARMNVDGTLDTAFNPAPNSFVRSIVLQPDGRILIGGSFTSLAPNGVSIGIHKYLARINPDGSLDPSIDPSPNDQVFAIAVQPDNKIVVGGVFLSSNSFGGQARNRIARLETDGRVDQTLNLNAQGLSVIATAVQPDGKILLGGSFNNILGVTRKFVARLNTDGTLDTNFNPNPNDYVGAIAVQSDGKILIGGDFTTLTPNGGATVTRNRVARLNADGSVDSTFDPNADDTVNAIAIQPDGKILLGGWFLSLTPNGGASVARGCIARLKTDGSIDNTFNPNANSDVFTITLQADGKILLGGRFTALAPNAGASVPRNFVARVNSDGSLDNAFDPNANDEVGAFAMQPDGKLLIAGSFSTLSPNGGIAVTRNRIARLNVDGTVDNGFNPNASDTVTAVALQADGRILIGGAFTSLTPNGGGSSVRSGFARLNADGSVDALDPQPNNQVLGITLQPDGKILLAGIFDSIGGQSRKIFARIANDAPAIQNLAVTQSSVTWTRSAAAAQLLRVSFEKSTDGVNYTLLGNGARVGTSNDFTLTGQNLPVQQNLYIRARGFYRGGQYNDSESITESVRNVFLPPALHLAFAQQPTNAPEKVVITPAVTVQILDAANNLVNSTAAVTLSLGNNPSAGTLSGTQTVSAINGTATFNNLSIDKLGAGYTLNASGTNFTSGISNAFNITVNAPSNISAVAGSGQSATISSAFANALQARVTDVNGNPVSGTVVTFTAPATGASGTFANNATTITANTDANGLAAASFSAGGTAGLYSVSASINGGAASTGFSLTNMKANQSISVTTHAPAGAVYNTQFSVGAGASSGLPVSYSSAGACTNNGPTFTMTSGTGNCTVKYDQAGDANHNAAPAMSETVAAQKAGQTITFDAIADKVFADSDFAVNASASSGLNVTLTSAGNCTNSGSTIHITGAGSCTITASQAGNSAYDAAPNLPRSFSIARAASTTNVVVSDAGYDGSAHGGSATATGAGGLNESLTLTYSGRNGTNYSATTPPTNAGDYTASASYAGDANHSSSSDSKNFSIGKAAQSISFDAISDRTFGDPDFSVNASANSGLQVSLAATGQCSISDKTVHLNGAGSCTLTASQSGDANDEAAPDVARSFQIAKASTTTQLAYSIDSGKGDQTTLAATVSSPAGMPGGNVTFKNDGTPIESCNSLAVASGLVSCVTSGVATGMHTFTAEYSGDGNFNASTGSVIGGQTGSIFQFSQATYVVAERGGSITLTVKRTGDVSSAASVDYLTDDGSVASVPVPCSLATGFALERCDYTRADGTLTFAANETEKSFVVLVNDDSYAEGTETVSLKLSNPGGGAVLGSQATATLQITDDASESLSNPIDDNSNFVRLNYHDFLNREPDTDGFNFWTNNIALCDTDGCGERKRVDTSAAFFLSIEFQETGYLVERFYKTAFGDRAGDSTLGGQHQLPVPIIRLREFLRDTQEIGQGVIVNQAGWQQQLENQKQAFAREFISRERFRNAYPDSMSAEQFINQLNANSGGVLTEAELAQLESIFGGPNASTADAVKRAQVLRSLAENQTLHQREFNRAFVLMQYFGYLRRNPNEAQDADYTGYDFWLRKLDQFNGNYINAEMVKAFISSNEYRQRFGQ